MMQELFSPSTQRVRLRSPWLSSTIAIFNLLMKFMPLYSPSKHLYLRAFPIQHPMWACHRCHSDIVIQLVASAALHQSSCPTTSHSKPLRLPRPNICSRFMFMALNRRARMIAVRPSSKSAWSSDCSPHRQPESPGGCMAWGSSVYP